MTNEWLFSKVFHQMINGEEFIPDDKFIEEVFPGIDVKKAKEWLHKHKGSTIGDYYIMHRTYHGIPLRGIENRQAIHVDEIHSKKLHREKRVPEKYREETVYKSHKHAEVKEREREHKENTDVNTNVNKKVDNKTIYTITVVGLLGIIAYLVIK